MIDKSTHSLIIELTKKYDEASTNVTVKITLQAPLETIAMSQK